MRAHCTSKKSIMEYWGPHAPGLDVVPKGCERNRLYFEIIDKRRYIMEPYILDLVDSFAQPGLLLEVSCGLGSDLRSFAKKGVTVVGIDISKENTLLAKHGLATMDLDCEVLNADAEHLPFRDCVFDKVYSWGVLHHTPNTQGAVDEIFRVLTLEGQVLIMIYHKGLNYYAILVYHGLLKFELMKLGHQELISRRYDSTPLSKMYSETEARQLFRKFHNVNFEILTYGGLSENPWFRFIWWLHNNIPSFRRFLGSFLIVHAMKGG